MEEQFILRVPPLVSERIERLFSENDDAPLDLTFAERKEKETHSHTSRRMISEDGRSGTYLIGNERFPAALLDLPCVVESYKTYDDNVLIKTANIGQMVMFREEGDPSPEGIEYRHGLTPPMRGARRRRFRREPDLNPELVQRVEKDLLNIMSGGTVSRMLRLPNQAQLVERLHRYLQPSQRLFQLKLLPQVVNLKEVILTIQWNMKIKADSNALKWH